MQYLLDTNTCIALMRHSPNVVARVTSLAPDECVISTITGYELFTGIAKCENPSQERAKVDLLLNVVVELPFDETSARHAGEIRGLLESRGEMIGPYDILLAGQAIATDLTLVTANLKEFQRVPGLTIENWLDPS